ncbi:MAG: hypothetical protein KC502_01880, partial [Myxococcales bacterium]|nr:hypothetical protein [Myxococcales bacterium]
MTRVVCRRVTATVVCALLFPAWSAWAAAVAPRLDKRVEIALLSPKNRAASDMIGVWVHDKQGVGLKETGPERNATWLAKAPTLGNAFVRVRIEGIRPKHFAILLRANAPKNKAGVADLSRVSGYQLALRGDGLTWMRRDNGVLRPLGASTKIRGLRRKRSVEVGVWMIGGHLMAQVYDGKTLDGLGGVSISDPRYAVGRVGLFTYARRASKSRVTWIGYTPTGPVQTPSKGQSSPKSTQSTAPAGNRRYGNLRRSQLMALPSALRRQVRVLEKVHNARGEPLLRVRARPAAFERLRRLDAVTDPLPIDTPFRYYDPRFLAARKAWKKGQTPSALTSYMDPEMVNDALRVWAKRYPKLVSLVEIGRSRSDRPILAVRIGKGDAHRKPAVLLNGTHHGDELMSTLYVMDAIETILTHYGTDEEIVRLIKGVSLWCVPLVNPDGAATFIAESTYSGRKNRRDSGNSAGAMEGVDLNRNYPFRWGGLGRKGSSTASHSMYYRGDRPGSEPETQAVMRLVDKHRFVASISYHTWGTVILTPYTIDGVTNPEPDDAEPVAALMAEEAGRQPNRRKFRVRRKIYAVDGTDQDWMRAAHGVVALLVEGPTHNPTWPARRVADIEAVRKTWQSLLRRVVGGPTLIGRVVDKSGNPLAADIRVDGVVPPNGERWTTRCHDGRVSRLLPSPGKHVIEAIVAGGPPIRKTVVVAEGSTVRVDFVAQQGAPATDCADPALCSVEARC